MTTAHIPVTQNRIKINWEGSLFVHHSLGMVNRELLSELIHDPRFDINIIPYEKDAFQPDINSKYYPLTRIPLTGHDCVDIHIRHRWPPDFSPPPSGKFICMQPWEYGSLPVSWVDAMNNTVDEIWVYTRYLKMCYEKSGVLPDKIHVIPLGIDPILFNPSATPSPIIKEMAKKRFCFLFNGGVTTRKGTDILINAYLNEFNVHEPVCLFIKDSNMYGKDLSEKVEALSKRDDIASIVYYSSDILHDELPGLYTAADCYVHPYRAEGFGLPIAEAMACGVPVIVTGGGACLDFVDPDSGYFIKCSIESMKSKQVSNLQTVDYPFWLVPDTRHLRSLLRYVYTNYDKASVIGTTAGNMMRTRHTWQISAAMAAQRIELLINPNKLIPNRDKDHEREKLINKALQLLKSELFDEATPLFQKVLLRYGESSVVYEGLAISAFYKKNYNESCNLFAAANRLSPTSENILINWYEAARMIGSTEELLRPVAQALQSNNSSDELRSLAIEIGVL